MNIFEIIAKQLAKLLDKLKIKSPLAFLFVQGNLVTVLALFSDNTINIPTPEFIAKWVPWLEFDGAVIAILASLIAMIGPRTYSLANSSPEEKV